VAPEEAEAAKEELREAEEVEEAVETDLKHHTMKESSSKEKVKTKRVMTREKIERAATRPLTRTHIITSICTAPDPNTSA
jgi:hypothetical protein